MTALLAKPYVPGKARGILHRGCDPVSTDRILLIDQRELTQLDWQPAGILVVDGAPFSHPMIRLLTLGIPAVLISSELADELIEGEEVFIDGLKGTVIKQPGAEQDTATRLEPGAAAETIRLTDGSEALLRASLFQAEEAKLAVEHGATAIGLVRTEFLLPEDGQQPDKAFYKMKQQRRSDIRVKQPGKKKGDHKEQGHGKDQRNSYQNPNKTSRNLLVLFLQRHVS